MKFCTWNARSVRNKSAVFQEYVCDNKIDLIALTETWLTANDVAVKVECTPPGHKMIGCPRADWRRHSLGLSVWISGF